MEFEVCVRSRRAVTPEGERPAAIAISGGTIKKIAEIDEIIEATRSLDFGERVLMPGLVDTHVHVNEPGRTEWEGFLTATRAAAAGGITTIVDMPLNSIPPTIDLAALVAKRAASEGKLRVDVGFWGGVVPGNTAHLRELAEQGVAGFKCFLVPSGVDEFPHVEESDLREALPVIRELGGVLLVHAEAPGPIEAAEKRVLAENPDPRRYWTYLATRPPQAELEAIEQLVRLARDTGARIHIVHLACADALELIRAAKQEGLPLTAETCPHYLYFDADSIEQGATAFKCAPPIRERRHAEALRAALRDGTIDFLVSDHSPCVPALKKLDTGSFLEAWGGIASLQLGLSIASTIGRESGIEFSDLARWMSATPARLCGLDDRKGSIEVGKDADFAVIEPDSSWVVHGSELAQRHPVTPYEGQTLVGRVVTTLLRGELIYDAGEFTGEPRGELLSCRPKP